MDIRYEDIFPTTGEEIGEKDIKIDSDSAIRESVRRLILEEISVEKPLSAVDDLIDIDGYVLVKGDSDGFDIFVMSGDGKKLSQIETILTSDKGTFMIPIPSHSTYEAGEAYDGHTVVWAKNHSDKSFGILAYEVAIELCSLYSNGLCPDRFEVSPEAYDVWKKYLQRPDVMTRQLDMEEYPMTPDPSDDGSVVSSVRAYYEWEDDFASNINAGLVGSKNYVKNIDFVKNWFSSDDPLSKNYYKTTFPVLEELIQNSMMGSEAIQMRSPEMMKDLWNKLGYIY